MTRRITILQGHPDPRGHHFGNALADGYADGARAAGHEVKCIEIAKLDFPLLRSSEDFYHGATPDGLLPAQTDPLGGPSSDRLSPMAWRTFRRFSMRSSNRYSGQASLFRFGKDRCPGNCSRERLHASSSPWVAPRHFIAGTTRAHSLKSLKRNILGFSGIGPIKTTLVGWLGGGAGVPEGAFPPLLSTTQRKRWLDKLHALGRQGC